MAYTIAFFGSKPYDEASFNEKNSGYGFELRYYKGHLNLNNVILTQGVDAVCIFVNDTADAEVIRQLAANGVKLLALRCAGYNNVDLNKTAECGIKVLRVPGYSPEAVAEHAMALVLTANRHTHKAYIKCRENNFSLNGLMGVNLYGKTAGIVGTGKIGLAMARICQGFGMKIVAYDLYPNESSGLEYVSLDRLLAISDLISLHCPLTPETHHMINKKSISRMKDGVILVNTSRGGLICTEDLITGIRDHKFWAVGLDVYEEESDFVYEDMSEYILKTSTVQRLLSFPNVALTSHQGFFTREAMHNIAETTLQNIQDFIDGKTLVNEVS